MVEPVRIAQPLLVFDNHDNDRSIDGFGDGARDVEIAKAIATMLFTSRDTAMTYYGAEIGMTTETPKRKEDVEEVPIGITGWPRERDAIAIVYCLLLVQLSLTITYCCINRLDGHSANVNRQNPSGPSKCQSAGRIGRGWRCSRRGNSFPPKTPCPACLLRSSEEPRPSFVRKSPGYGFLGNW